MEEDIAVSVEDPEGLTSAVQEFVGQLDDKTVRYVVELQMISYMVEQMFPAKQAGTHLKKTHELFYKLGLRLMKLPKPSGALN